MATLLQNPFPNGDCEQCGIADSPSSLELTRVQEALRASERRYQRLVETITTYTYSVEMHAGLPVATRHSPGCCAATGYSPEDYAADPHLWFRMVHPQDREAVRADLARILASCSVPPMEHRILRADGATRWVRDTVILHRDDSGAVVRYDGLVEDVTQRKQVEERFRQLVEFAPDAMVVSDHEGRIVVVNETTERLFGYPREELLGQCIEVLVPEPLRAQHRRDRQTYSACPHARPMGAMRGMPCLRRDGSQFFADISLCPLQTDQGVLVYAAIRDITQQRLAEKHSREWEAQLLAARQVQESLLPSRSPTLAGFDIAGASFPAEHVGGDSFDYLPMGDGALGLAIGDVVGHGVASALVMASTHAYIRSLARIYSDPAEILGLANSILVEENHGERFVTFLLGRLDPHAPSFQFCGAGHPQGYVLDAGGEIKHILRGVDLPLGVVAGAKYHLSTCLALTAGDLLLLITDGVVEAQSPSGELFGDNRMLELVRGQRAKTSRAIIEDLHHAVAQYAGGESLEDDVTMVIVKIV